jgi:antitoxin component YwqK of YwqJK toxin-antitoxin module
MIGNWNVYNKKGNIKRKEYYPYYTDTSTIIVDYFDSKNRKSKTIKYLYKNEIKDLKKYFYQEGNPPNPDKYYCIFYYTNGNKSHESLFRRQGIYKNVYHGKGIGYYRNGSIRIISNSKLSDGDLHGKYKKWYKSGELKVNGQYKNGNKHGNWIRYKRKGKEKKVTIVGLIEWLFNDV